KGGKILQYDVGDGGQLSPKNPAAMTTVPTPSAVAVSSDGGSGYVANDGSGGQGTALVYQFDVGGDGARSPKSTPHVVADDGSNSLVVSPDDTSVYVTNGDADTVSQYDVGAGGALSPKSVAEVGTGDTPSQLALSADGASAYVAGSGDGSISLYD